MPPSTPLSDYYKSINLSPVEHDLESEERFRVHYQKRRNLMANCLKLPALLWKDTEVLEFGPGSGENSVILAKDGARLTLVEPLDYLIQKLENKFAAAGLRDSLHEVRQISLERFTTTEKFDVVLAEGFLHFMDDPIAAIQKLAGFVKDEGFLVISIVHTAGTFIEFVKRTFLCLMIARSGAKTDAERLACAQRLFYPDFKKINHSRSFESWAKDTVLNPLYNRDSFLDFKDVWGCLPRNFRLYSSWPNYADHDTLVWHKTIKSPDKIRAETLDAYYARYPHFLHSIPPKRGQVALFEPAAGRKTATLTDRCLAAMDKVVQNDGASAAGIISALRALEKGLKGHVQAKDAQAVIADCIKLFTSMDYAKRKLLRQTWGSPGHYYVFQRSDLNK